MKENKIIAYKGFDENLCCRGFQYEIGKEYEQQGAIKCCENGFHACSNPFDVLDFYGNNCTNRFAEVEQSGTIVIREDGKTQASSKIKIKAEIGITGLFDAGIEWIKEITNPDKIIKETKLNGDFSSHDCVNIRSRGREVTIASCDYANIDSSGNGAKIGSSGEYAKIGSSGCKVSIGSIGDDAKISSSGRWASIASSGDYAIIASSGRSAIIASSGRWASIASSGDYASISASGTYAKIYSTGRNANICCSGRDSMAKAKISSLITLSEWDLSSDNIWEPVCVKTAYVDGKRIKEDTWYKLIGGEFVEQ